MAFLKTFVNKKRCGQSLKCSDQNVIIVESKIILCAIKNTAD